MGDLALDSIGKLQSMAHHDLRSALDLLQNVCPSSSSITVMCTSYVGNFTSQDSDMVLHSCCADWSSPQISAILVGSFTVENVSLRKSPQFSATNPQQLRRQISTSWLTKFPTRMSCTFGPAARPFLIQPIRYPRCSDLIVHAYRRIGSSLQFMVELHRSCIKGLSSLCLCGFCDVMLHLVIVGAGHILYLLPPLLLRVIRSLAEHVQGGGVMADHESELSQQILGF